MFLTSKLKGTSDLVTPYCIDCGWTCTEYCSGATCETGCVGECMFICSFTVRTH
ncbi:MAG: hypothetical protein K6T75_09245 [Acetobacteraceae bacterium]|nr:hypothetical protein [Acetobacteraceae bacterium]